MFGELGNLLLEILDPLPLRQRGVEEFVELCLEIANPILRHLKLKHAEFSVVEDALGGAQLGALLVQTLHILFD